MALGDGSAPRRRLRAQAEGTSVRTDLAQAGGDGDRAGGELDQGRVEPGAPEGDRDRQLPDRAGPGSGRDLQDDRANADEGSAVEREGDVHADGGVQVVDDRPD